MALTVMSDSNIQNTVPIVVPPRTPFATNETTKINARRRRKTSESKTSSQDATSHGTSASQHARKRQTHSSQPEKEADVAGATTTKTIDRDMASTTAQAQQQRQQQEPPTQAVMNRYRQLGQESQRLAAKISELELDRNEHWLVETTLQPLDADRRAYRLVNQILVERTVGEVLPSVKKNRENVSEYRMTMLLPTCRRRLSLVCM